MPSSGSIARSTRDHGLGSLGLLVVSSVASASSRDKSSDAFPWISSAWRCLASWDSRRSFFFFSALDLALGRSSVLRSWGLVAEGADLARPAPFDDVARVEALATEQRPLAAGVGSVVLLEDRELVRGAERRRWVSPRGRRRARPHHGRAG